MAEEYSIEVCEKLKSEFRSAGMYRPMRAERYDAGDELEYDIKAVAGTDAGKVRLVVERFVGGGFAGQVYRVKVVEIDARNKGIGGLRVGEFYAMKILIPSSGFSRLFRNTLYWVGFQGPFQLQVNPEAARAGALWQKFIRRGAKIRLGDESAVVDIHATFVDNMLGACGELSEWVQGRTWRLEVDDRLDLLKHWRKGKVIETRLLGSPEYRAKNEFMRQFVELLHEMGGHEFARQYEWSTCKSQPNCLKRKDTEADPSAGLVAVDFRAGLALLPFLPMSPGDFKLIFKGLGRGSLVQFDRGNLSKLEKFIDSHADDFVGMQGMLDELKTCERVYRNSVPDITHNHIRLLYSKLLWSTILDSAVTGWKVRNIFDDVGIKKLRQSRFLTLVFLIFGLIPVLGRFIQKLFGHAGWRRHYGNLFSNWGYLKRAFRAKITEKAIAWHREGRVDGSEALRLPSAFWRLFIHLPLSIAPVGLHKILTNWPYAKNRLYYLFVRPVRLYFDEALRKQWLGEMVDEGRKKQILSDDDAAVIFSQVGEPFIQKYLKSLAVHVCTLPVTQIVSVTVAMIYILMHPEMPRAQAWGIGLGIIALFQVVPISPGSLVRGLYVVYLVMKERNFKDYNIAVFLGFFKYIGYLAFPIQMTYRYPVLARFMAGHWANESVHLVPVFGESGALLEHWVFRLFYNWPLTVRRRIRKRLEKRASMKNRFWHIGVCAVAAAGIFGFADFIYLKNMGQLPGPMEPWWLTVIIPTGCGTLVTLGCGGATLTKRFVGAVICGALIGILSTAITAILSQNGGIMGVDIMVTCLWRCFVFSIFSIVGAIVTELKLPDPDLV